ncbi:MAG: hypothetical protein Q9215_000389 [Flavoplaca cf. flavocitrina]
MKSIIVSAFFGAALLAIQGVSGAAVPTDIVERNEAFQVHSENIKSPAVKRAPLPDFSSTNICIHNTEGSVECSDVMVKRENVPYEDTLEKRKMKFRDNYEDKADEYVSHVLAPRDVASQSSGMELIYRLFGTNHPQTDNSAPLCETDNLTQLQTQPLRPVTKWIAAVQQPAELVVARRMETPTALRVKPTRSSAVQNLRRAPRRLDKTIRAASGIHVLCRGAFAMRTAFVG